MRAAAAAVALGLVFAPVLYVRRAWLPPGHVVQVVEDSRDRALHGKARRRARRGRAA